MRIGKAHPIPKTVTHFEILERARFLFSGISVMFAMI